MRPSLSHLPGQPVTACVDGGRAAFRRLGPSSAVLDLEYEVPHLEARLEDGDLQRGVEALCEAEVAAVRRAISRLSEELAARLPDEGEAPSLRRSWGDDDERSWADRGASFAVDASAYRGRDTLRTREGVSDARLVRDVLHLWCEQRQQAVRALYRQMLADALAARAADRARQF